jgi:outer membrane lipoprotein-sorting protein
MRLLLSLALLVVTAWPAAAGENEAEKLFRGMEKNVREAKTLQLHFDATITDGNAEKWNAKGTLVLGEGDKLRMESESKLSGFEVKFTIVSDGTDMMRSDSTKAPGKPKDDRTKTDKSPKDFGVYFRGALPRDGLFVSFQNLDRRGDFPADIFKLSDFKLAGKETIGERNTQVLQYTITMKEKGKNKEPNVLSMKMWLDAKTNLPVKMAMTGGRSGITDVTETYSEFTIDGKVDAKSFELPK